MGVACAVAPPRTDASGVPAGLHVHAASGSCDTTLAAGAVAYTGSDAPAEYAGSRSYM